MWRQANWDEPLIYELSSNKKRKQGIIIPEENIDVKIDIPEKIKRKNDLEIPELSELEVVRHFIRLSQHNFGVDLGMMPLGSCTMKYNPKVEELTSRVVENYHPLQDEDTVQGILEMMYEMQKWLAEMT
ncbi:MAG: aminomethyl-transferring glycine dehydrogenase subunit GcvPB, partial [Acidianus infernus]|nr:aminomethyl-transferring glycine dehydrogenase subunit GcvPB [Acidianus infernus]